MDDFYGRKDESDIKYRSPVVVVVLQWLQACNS